MLVVVVVELVVAVLGQHLLVDQEVEVLEEKVFHHLEFLELPLLAAAAAVAVLFHHLKTPEDPVVPE